MGVEKILAKLINTENNQIYTLFTESYNSQPKISLVWFDPSKINFNKKQLNKTIQTIPSML